MNRARKILALAMEKNETARKSSTKENYLPSFKMKRQDNISNNESHYLRKQTSKEYIDGGLSVAEMHRHYSKERSLAGKPVAKYETYSQIFNTKFNIGFFIPKKDQCDLCEAYKNASETEKENLKNCYEVHLEEKTLSRAEKASDKQKAVANDSKMVLCVYDLQAVLSVHPFIQWDKHQPFFINQD